MIMGKIKIHKRPTGGVFRVRMGCGVDSISMVKADRDFQFFAKFVKLLKMIFGKIKIHTHPTGGVFRVRMGCGVDVNSVVMADRDF